jgi:hypothetical protein
MTIQAVAVLQTMIRDEFERDWNGFDEPFSFLDGSPWDDPPKPPIPEIVVDLAGKSYVFPAKDIVEVIQSDLESFRYEIEEAQDAAQDPEDWHFTANWLDDDQIAEMAWDRTITHWSRQLDNIEETMAAIEFRGDYLVKSFQELVATLEMVSERMPELAPHCAQKLQEVWEYSSKLLNETIARWEQEADKA